jgi:DNA-binding GntR family transcriptional regulator
LRQVLRNPGSPEKSAADFRAPEFTFKAKFLSSCQLPRRRSILLLSTTKHLGRARLARQAAPFRVSGVSFWCVTGINAKEHARISEALASGRLAGAKQAAREAMHALGLTLAVPDSEQELKELYKAVAKAQKEERVIFRRS